MPRTLDSVQKTSDRAVGADPNLTRRLAKHLIETMVWNMQDMCKAQCHRPVVHCEWSHAGDGDGQTLYWKLVKTKSERLVPAGD